VFIYTLSNEINALEGCDMLFREYGLKYTHRFIPCMRLIYIRFMWWQVSLPFHAHSFFLAFLDLNFSFVKVRQGIDVILN